MTEKEKKVIALARKIRRHDKARAQAEQEARNHQFAKNAAWEDAMAAGITHDELWHEVLSQNEEAER